jgi:hypothetical protein
MSKRVRAERALRTSARLEKYARTSNSHRGDSSWLRNRGRLFCAGGCEDYRDFPARGIDLDAIDRQVFLARGADGALKIGEFEADGLARHTDTPPFGEGLSAADSVFSPWRFVFVKLPYFARRLVCLLPAPSCSYIELHRTLVVHRYALTCCGTGGSKYPQLSRRLIGRAISNHDVRSLRRRSVDIPSTAARSRPRSAPWPPR